jgi:hypothetical protein
MRTPLRRSIAQVLKIARAGGRSLRRLRPGKLGSEFLVLFPQPLIIHLRLAVSRPPGRLNGKTLITRLTPLLDMRVIEALTAQQRSPVTPIGKLVVLLDDRQLVRQGEGPLRPVSPRTPRGGHQAILLCGRRHVCNGQCHASRRSRLALLTTEVYFILMSHGSLTERGAKQHLVARLKFSFPTSVSDVVADHVMQAQCCRTVRPSQHRQ